MQLMEVPQRIGFEGRKKFMHGVAPCLQQENVPQMGRFKNP